MDSGFDIVLVERASRESSDESFPNSRTVASKFQRVAVVLPLVEISNYMDLFCIRSPDCEMRAFFPVEFDGMGAKFLIELEVSSFFEEVDVVWRQ